MNETPHEKNNHTTFTVGGGVAKRSGSSNIWLPGATKPQFMCAAPIGVL